MPVITALNKIDMISRKEELISKIAALSEQYDFEAIVPVSAKTGEGIEALLSELKKHAENSPHFFPDDTLTDQPERVLAAEMIREKCSACLIRRYLTVLRFPSSLCASVIRAILWT